MVEIGLLVIGVIIIGLPLLALGVDRVLPPPRRRPNPLNREPGEMVRREFGLSWQDQLEVLAAVQQGRVVARPELRPATRRLAELVLRPPHPTFRGRPINEYPRWQRFLAQLLLATFTLVYVAVVLGRGRVDSAVTYVVVSMVFFVVGQVFRRRRRRRAVDAMTANH